MADPAKDDEADSDNLVDICVELGQLWSLWDGHTMQTLEWGKYVI